MTNKKEDYKSADGVFKATDSDTDNEKWMRELSRIAWTVKDGKAKPPKFEFPKDVQERLDWVVKNTNPENCGVAVSFWGEVKFLFEDTPEVRHEWESFSTAPWMPITKKFEDWAFPFFFSWTRQLSMILYLAYGNTKK